MTEQTLFNSFSHKMALSELVYFVIYIKKAYRDDPMSESLRNLLSMLQTWLGGKPLKEI